MANTLLKAAADKVIQQNENQWETIMYVFPMLYLFFERSVILKIHFV